MLRLSDAVLQRLILAHPLADALKPFAAAKGVDAASPFEVVAFLHAFGVCGPRTQHWNTLFTCVASLRPEDIAVIVAFVACGFPSDRQSVSDVVFGSANTPSMLDKVCQLWDEWLLSEPFLTSLTSDKVRQRAEVWSLQKTGQGFVWQCGEGNCNGGEFSQHALGDAVHVCGLNIVNSVLPSVVEEIYRRMSMNGRQRAVELLTSRTNAVFPVVLQHAESVLINRVYECMAAGGGLV